MRVPPPAWYLSETLGTAVILQRMVFGNAGALSGSGVGFTRDPATGERRPYVEFLPDAQGEDIVGGRSTQDGAGQLALLAPEVNQRLDEVSRVLEAEFHDAQEFEFTDRGRRAVRAAGARGEADAVGGAAGSAADQVQRGPGIEHRGRARAARRPGPAGALRRRRVDAAAAPESTRSAHATPAGARGCRGPGRLALDAEAAERHRGRQGRQPVLDAPRQAATADLAGVRVAAGLLTGSGGRPDLPRGGRGARAGQSRASWASSAVERPGPCRVRIGEREFAEGDQISIDGESGRVFAGAVQVDEERPTDDLAIVAGWQTT